MFRVRYHLAGSCAQLLKVFADELGTTNYVYVRASLPLANVRFRYRKNWNPRGYRGYHGMLPAYLRRVDVQIGDQSQPRLLDRVARRYEEYPVERYLLVVEKLLDVRLRLYRIPHEHHDCPRERAQQMGEHLQQIWL